MEEEISKGETGENGNDRNGYKDGIINPIFIEEVFMKFVIIKFVINSKSGSFEFNETIGIFFTNIFVKFSIII